MEEVVQGFVRIVAAAPRFLRMDGFRAFMEMAELADPNWGLGTDVSSLIVGEERWQHNVHSISRSFAGAFEDVDTYVEGARRVFCLRRDASSLTWIPLTRVGVLVSSTGCSQASNGVLRATKFEIASVKLRNAYVSFHVPDAMYTEGMPCADINLHQQGKALEDNAQPTSLHCICAFALCLGAKGSSRNPHPLDR